MSVEINRSPRSRNACKDLCQKIWVRSKYQIKFLIVHHCWKLQVELISWNNKKIIHIEVIIFWLIYIIIFSTIWSTLLNESFKIPVGHLLTKLPTRWHPCMDSWPEPLGPNTWEFMLISQNWEVSLQEWYNPTQIRCTALMSIHNIRKSYNEYDHHWRVWSQSSKSFIKDASLNAAIIFWQALYQIGYCSWNIVICLSIMPPLIQYSQNTNWPLVITCLLSR